MKAPVRSHRRAPDFSRQREGYRGMPRNWLSYGVVGHSQGTPAYARVEDGDVLVEVTLVPSGEEVVCRLDTGSMDGGGFYLPLAFGQRVVVAVPYGRSGDLVIVGRVSDATWPFPEEVGGLDVSGRQAPMLAFLKTADGQVLVLETGEGGDLLVRSGSHVKVEARPGAQVIVKGRTHIGASVDFEQQPEPATVGQDGAVDVGEPAQGYAPAPNTNPTTPPPTDPNTGLPLPADGVVRIKDRVQSNNAIDATFWAWVAAVQASLSAVIAAVNAQHNLALTPPPFVPTKLESLPMSGSANTCADD